MEKLSVSRLAILAIGLFLALRSATVAGKEGESVLAKLSEKFANSLTVPPFIEKLLLDVLPKYVGQRPCNEFGEFERYREYIFTDHSNDEIEDSTVHQIISRSGYNYSSHKVTSDDGYETELVRVINPEADESQLKQPPVMIMHGGIINPTAYVWASSIQHHPEKYPRDYDVDGPITSSNRSIAFILANNGYDVWLVFTRGSDIKNKVRNPVKPMESAVSGRFAARNTTLGETLFSMTQMDYWMFSMDHIVKFEMPVQIKKILEVTGAEKVSIFAFSFSTILSLSMFADDPEFTAENVHSAIMMAPILTDKGASALIRMAYRDVIAKVPALFGNRLGTELIIPQVRFFIKILLRFKGLLYTFGKFLVSLFLGTSGKYRTFFEPAVMGHVFLETSYMQIQHYAQQVIAGRLQKYDYGATKNMLIYGRDEPPVYNLTRIPLENWMLLTAGNDNLATPESSELLLSLMPTEPQKHIFVKGYSHLDMAAAVDNAKHVNLPVLEFMEANRLQ